MRAAILITCYNRKKKTLNCFRKAFIALQEVPHINFEFYLVDDGSSDGTYDAITNFFPKVNIIRSEGGLYWNRGMRLAWMNASSEKDFDFYIWLNDDLELHHDSFKILFNDYNSLENKKSILCGLCESEDHIITYGGYLLESRKRLVLNGQIQQCDYFNGNFILIPRSVFLDVGMLDKLFHHSKGDFDYGLRSKKYGIKSYVTSCVVGRCERHDVVPDWCNPRYNLFRRISAFYTPLGAEPFRSFVFESRHYGFFIAIFHMVTIHLRLIFPWIWKLLAKDLRYLK